MQKECLQAYEAWLAAPALQEDLRRELLAIREKPAEIEERFYTELAFGTAGLRGVLGAGTNRMNVHVVRRATQGLAAYLLGYPDARTRGVAIAYDSRHMSAEFALETALVLCQNGIRAYLYDTLHSVPQLSFTVLHLGCMAGVVITASHNPPKYNGYKVYWEHGGQAGPEQAAAILRCIDAIGYFDAQPMAEQAALDAGLLVKIGAEVDEAYYAATESLLLHPALLREDGKDFTLVYTPLHGTGNVPVRTLLRRVGMENVHIVPEQAAPDGAFPTVSAPNPEDPDAFTLARKLADEVGASVILATDPDADRLGAAVRKRDGSFQVLTGNQIGSILIHYILSSKAAAGTLPTNGLVVKSLVSTRMADAICEKFQTELQDVLTGFRFISEKIAESLASGAHTFLFGFEESFGFLAGTFSRDKDAICAAMLLAEACVFYKRQGMTLYDVLQQMYGLYGYYKEAVKSYTLEGKEGIEKIKNAMTGLRKAPPTAFGGVAVTRSEDLLAGSDFPPSDVLRYSLADGAWVVVRPSGTEPKLKLYIGANAAEETQVDVLLSALMADADSLLGGYLR